MALCKCLNLCMTSTLPACLLMACLPTNHMKPRSAARPPSPARRLCAESMGLSIELLRAIKRKGFRLPTPIQRRAMPVVLQGMDVIGMARTGSGKTAAFVIPMLERYGKVWGGQS